SRSRRVSRNNKVPTIRSQKEHLAASSKALINAFEEVLNYDPSRHHNRPPPDLRIEDSNYLEEVRILAGELRRLNDLLEKTQINKPQTKHAVLQFQKHFDGFLNRFATSLATGAAGLLIATGGALLYEAGVGHESVSQ